MHLRNMKLLYLGFVLIVTLVPNNAAPKPQEDGGISVGAVMSSATLVNDPNYTINMKKSNSSVRVVVIRRKKNNEDVSQAVIDKNVNVRNTFDSLLSKSSDGQPLFEPRKSKRIWPVRKNSTERANNDYETTQSSVSGSSQHKRKWQLGKNGPKVEEISETDNYPEEFKRRKLHPVSQNSSQIQSLNSESDTQKQVNIGVTTNRNTNVNLERLGGSQQGRKVPNQSTSGDFASRSGQRFSTSLSTTTEDNFTIRPDLPQPLNSGIGFNNQDKSTTNNYYNSFSFKTSSQAPAFSLSTTRNYEDNYSTRSGISQFPNSQSTFNNERLSTQQTFSPFSFSTTQKPFISSSTTNRQESISLLNKQAFGNTFTTPKSTPTYGNSQIGKSDKILNQFKLARVVDDVEPLTIEFTDDVLASLTPKNGQPFGKALSKQTEVSNDYFKALSGQLTDDKAAITNRRRLISEIQKSVDEEDKAFVLGASDVELDYEDETLKKLSNRPTVESFESVFGFTKSNDKKDDIPNSFQQQPTINQNTDRNPTVRYENGRFKIDLGESGINQNINLKIGTNLGPDNIVRTTQIVPETSFSSNPVLSTNNPTFGRFNVGNSFKASNDFSSTNLNNDAFNNNYFTSTASPRGSSSSFGSQADYTSTASHRGSSYSFGSQADYTTKIPSPRGSSYSFGSQADYTSTASPRGSSYSFGSQADYTSTASPRGSSYSFGSHADYTSTASPRGSSYSFGSQVDYTTTALPIEQKTQNSFSNFGSATGNSSPQPFLNNFENTRDTPTTKQNYHIFGGENLSTTNYNPISSSNFASQTTTNFPSTSFNSYSTPSSTTARKHGSFSFGTSIDGNSQGNVQTSGRGFGTSFQEKSENDSPIIRISTIQPSQSQFRSLNSGFQNTNSFGSYQQTEIPPIAANVNNLQPIGNNYQNNNQQNPEAGISIQNKNNNERKENSNFGTFNAFSTSNPGVRRQASNSENDQYRRDSSFNTNIKNSVNETTSKNNAFNTNRFGDSILNSESSSSNNSQQLGNSKAEPNNSVNVETSTYSSGQNYNFNRRISTPAYNSQDSVQKGDGSVGSGKINTQNGFLSNTTPFINTAKESNAYNIENSTFSLTKNNNDNSNNQYNSVNNKQFSQTTGNYNVKRQHIVNSSFENPSTYKQANYDITEKTVSRSKLNSQSDLNTVANATVKGLSNNKQTYYVNSAGEKVYDNNSRLSQREKSNTGRNRSSNSDLSLAQSSLYGGRDEDVQDLVDDVNDLERGAKKYKPTRFETISPFVSDSHYKQIYQNNQVPSQNGGQQILTRGTSNFDLEAKKSISRDEFDLNVDDNSINTDGRNKNQNGNIYRGSVKFKFDPYSIDYDDETSDFPDQFGFKYNTSNGISAYQKGVAKKINNRKVFVVYGSYQYTAPDGTPIYVNYTADENGFRTQESHLPIFLEEPKTTRKGGELTSTEKIELENENDSSVE